MPHHFEYLLFNLLVLAGPLLLSLGGRSFFIHRWPAVFATILPISAVFLVWDVLVTGRHWSFNPDYSLPPILGLPPGEWLFFFSVPYALIFSWEFLVAPLEGGRQETRRWWYFSALLPAIGAVAAFAAGREYTMLACLALSLALIFDLVWGGRILCYRRYPRFLFLVVGSTLVFNAYLAGRPVVLYEPRFFLGVRVFHMPIEDIAYGLALLHCMASLYQKQRDNSPLDRFIRRRLQGYKITVSEDSSELPARFEANAAFPEAPRIAVVGAGLAGLSAAVHLAERGFAVTVLEAHDYVGGKLGSWETQSAQGRRRVEHGFHAFFRHYYNLNRFFDRYALRRDFKAIDDYAIVAQDASVHRFSTLHRTPVLNILSMLSTEMLNWRDLANPRMQAMELFLKYDPVRTFEEYDGVSFRQFLDHNQLPDSLRLVFNNFSRSFFAEPEDISLAELAKSFHSYFLSHDEGLLYDHPADDHEYTVLAPLRAALAQHSAQLRLGCEVNSIQREESGWRVNDESFDALVIASDLRGAQSLVRKNAGLEQALGSVAQNLGEMGSSQGYAVLRLWLSGRFTEETPGFVLVDRRRVLDSVSFYDRIERESAKWAAESNGCVVELHCYSVPRELFVRDGQATALRDALLNDFHHFYPQLADFEIIDEFMHCDDNFTSYGLNQAAKRPRVATPDPTLVLAGDWVHLPYPAMLMEAAVSSGMEANNALCRHFGVRGEKIESVPLKGLLA